MDTTYSAGSLRRLSWLLAGTLLALALALGLADTLAAQVTPPDLVGAPLAVDLSGSTKRVDRAEAQPGDMLAYTIVLSNSGTSTAPDIQLSDPIPAGTTYVPGSLSVTGGGIYGVTGGVVNWLGAVNVGSPITIRFNTAVSSGLTLDTTITNTALLSGTGGPLTLTATTLITEPSIALMFMPTAYRPPLWQPVLSEPDLINETTWSFDWSPFTEEVLYELDESMDPNFGTFNRFDVGNAPGVLINRPASYDNQYYYRLRARTATLESDWSDTVDATLPYRDNFNTSASGWAIRRQDTDDVENSSYYENGFFVLKIGGRWDYAIAAPLRQAPKGSYRIEMDMRLDEPKNLNTGGIIWGGDYLGGTCPNADYSSCFNHYYRLIILWYGSPDTMRIQVKRIDFHEAPSNAGRGDTLIDWSDIVVGDPVATHVWAVEYTTSGNIRIFVDGKQVASATDATYVNDRYFGIWASTDEYLGAEPTLDYLRVVPID